MLLLGRRKEQVRHEKALIVNAIVQRKRSMCIYRTRIRLIPMPILVASHRMKLGRFVTLASTYF